MRVFGGRRRNLRLAQLTAGFLLASLLICASLFLPKVQNQSERARSADAFVDSIGVNVHLTYDQTPYGRGYETIIKPQLQELGIRHIRDGMVLNRERYYNRLKELASVNIRSTLIAGIGWVTPKQAVELAQRLGDAMEAVEGPNEYDARNRDPKQWVPALRDYMQQLKAEFSQNRATSRLPILGPSFIKGDSSTRIGDLRPWVTHGNMHPYSYPHHPGNGNIKNEIANRSKPTVGKPIIATETGYHTGGAGSDRPIPENVQGKYIPRLFLECFNAGVVRTFSYEFIDQRVRPRDREANFGILHNDGSPKPAFTNLKKLISLLKDPGPQFSLDNLDYTLRGNLRKIHHTLLQKRDGTFYLLLWLEAPSFDRIRNRAFTVRSEPITLTLNQKIKDVVIYSDIDTTNPGQQYRMPQQLRLNVPDYPLVVKLTPA
ncbi:hypothetical protein [Leptolyngbya sp. FACHB-261]|uniref:hypothetical protein n=1 Tax=Leptolyngbya sp. FACHB-261 TaxID=2692806 RepID=UPI001685EDFB|nr:hypothetical protein [Leptolyngbya sp. FACHB-261]MBD2101122.1 hypothetical protein [Leptolyngbya sp. FACHB-261]